MENIFQVLFVDSYLKSFIFLSYSQTYSISHTLTGNKIVDHSEVVGASPVVTAPTTYSFSP